MATDDTPENSEPPRSLTEITRNRAMAQLLQRGFAQAAQRVKDPELAKKFEAVAAGKASLRDVMTDPAVGELSSRGLDAMLRRRAEMAEEERAELDAAADDLAGQALADPTRHPVLPADELHPHDSRHYEPEIDRDVLAHAEPDPIVDTDDPFTRESDDPDETDGPDEPDPDARRVPRR